MSSSVARSASHRCDPGLQNLAQGYQVFVRALPERELSLDAVGDHGEGDDIRYVGTIADLHVHQPALFQQTNGFTDGRPVDAEQLGQLTLGGQLRTPFDLTFRDHGLYRICNLLVQVLASQTERPEEFRLI